MRSAIVVLAIIFVAVPAFGQATRRQRPAAASQQHSQEEDQKAITDLQRRDIDANIAVDTDKIMALRTDDVVYLVPGRTPVVGQDAVRAYLEEIRKQLVDWDMVGYEENWQEVQVAGDVAYEWGTINIRAQQTGEKRESSAIRNVMQVLKRQPGGDWKIARAIWNIQGPQSGPTAAAKPAEKPKE
jgi:uncharacterized protein (TIGR02246 family)